MARDLGNPTDVSRVKRRADVRERALANALTAMMSHKQTRAWLYDLLEFCNLYKSSFATSGLVMAQNEGQRNVGLKILADIMRVSPEQYVLMLQEQKETEDGSDSESERPSSQRPGSDPRAGSSGFADTESDPFAG